MYVFARSFLAKPLLAGGARQDKLAGWRLEAAHVRQAFVERSDDLVQPLGAAGDRVPNSVSTEARSLVSSAAMRCLLSCHRIRSFRNVTLEGGSVPASLSSISSIKSSGRMRRPQDRERGAAWAQDC